MIIVPNPVVYQIHVGCNSGFIGNFLTFGIDNDQWQQGAVLQKRRVEPLRGAMVVTTSVYNPRMQVGIGAQIR